MIDPTLWQRLAKQEPADVCSRAEVTYDASVASYRVPLLGHVHLVDPGHRTVTLEQPGGPDRKPGFQEHLVSVVYLLSATQREPTGKLVKPESLPAGEFFFRHLHAMPTGKIEDAFGQDPGCLIEAGRALGANPVAYGDAAVELPALPRVPLTFIVWGADEEFPPKASVLVDQTAADQLPLDALWTFADLAARRLIEAAPETA